MRLQRQLEVAIRLEALAAEAPALLVGVDDFGDARDSAAIAAAAGRARLTSRSAAGSRGLHGEVHRRRRIHATARRDTPGAA